MQTANDNHKYSLEAELIGLELASAFLAGFEHGLTSKPRKITGYTSSGNGSAIPVYGEAE